jgi:hypothetical protein
MENNVVTLETAKKLKAAGFPQDDSPYYWYRCTEGYGPDWHLIGNADHRFKTTIGGQSLCFRQDDYDDLLSAPIAQEIMDELVSDRRSGDLTFRPFNEDDKSWLLEADGRRSTYYVEDDNNIAELVAGAWLKLHESQGGAER